MGKKAEAAIPDDLSIHPRNWINVPGFGAGTRNTKRNTARPVRGRARKLDRKQKRLTARIADLASTKSKNQVAYRRPGSMNEGK